MEFQSVRGFEKEEAIREAFEAFLSSNNSTVIFVRGSANEFEVMI